MRKQILFILAFVTCILCSAQSNTAEVMIADLMNRHHIASLMAVAVKDGETIWEGAYGYADIGRKIKAYPDTVIRVASISKTVTSAVLMGLYEQGKFTLDQDIGTVLGYKVRNPGFPDSPVTFRQLLTHTSSIIDSANYGSLMSASYGSYPASMKEFLCPGGKYYSSANFGKYKPGSGTFSYSNFCFGLLGTLAEKLSGKRFDILVREMLKKMKITGSFNVQDLPDMNKLAVTYRYSSGNHTATSDNYGGVKPQAVNYSAYKPGVNALGFGPQGGIRLSVRDMAAMMKMFISGGVFQGERILKSETVDLMCSKQWEGYGFGGLYRKKGLGLHITDDFIPGMELTGHTGIAYGILADMYFSRVNKLGIAIIINGSLNKQSGVFHDVEEKLIDIISSEILKI